MTVKPAETGMTQRWLFGLLRNPVKCHGLSGTQNVLGHLCDKEQNYSSVVTLRHDVASVHTNLNAGQKFNVCEGDNYLLNQGEFRDVCLDC